MADGVIVLKLSRWIKMLMRIFKRENGNLVVVGRPLLAYGPSLLDRKIAGHPDEGRLFAITPTDATNGMAATNVRLLCIGDNSDGDRERKREMELIQNPQETIRNDDGDTIVTYLGRYTVYKVSGVLNLGPINTMPESQVELAPAPIPVLDWETSEDGEEMMTLAAQAGVDSQKLLAASALCARLSFHLTRNAPQARQALESVEGWCRGTVTEDDMERVVCENNLAHDDGLSRLDFGNWAASHAQAAASCFPPRVVKNVINAFECAIDEAHQNACPSVLQAHKQEVRKALLAACANLIRSVIKTADFPELVARIERRNADLCLAPNHGFIWAEKLSIW